MEIEDKEEGGRDISGNFSKKNEKRLFVFLIMM